MRDFIEFFAPVLILIGSVIGLLTVGLNYFNAYQCENYEEITGKRTKYANFDACYIETAEGFQRYDEYKARAVASEGLGTK